MLLSMLDVIVRLVYFDNIEKKKKISSCIKNCRCLTCKNDYVDKKLGNQKPRPSRLEVKIIFRFNLLKACLVM